jgi:signal transduction histidine kinase
MTMSLFERFSLSKRLFIVVVSFGFLLSLIFAVIIVSANRNYHAEVIQADAMSQVVRAAALFPSLGQLAISDPGAANALLRNFPFDSQTGVYVIDATGRVLASSGQPMAHWQTWRINMRDVQAIFLAPRYGKMLGDDPDKIGERCLFAVAPLELSPGQSGYLYLQLRAAQARSTEMFAATGSAVRAALWVGLVVALVGLMLTLVVLGVLTRPLRKLTTTIDDILQHGLSATPDYAVLPAAGEHDEISRLSKAFQSLLMHIRNQIKRLERTDALRRELVASVSHDLRSPLTSLIGHLETLKLDVSISIPGERLQQLDIALKNAQQINRLSSSLFELALLDSDEFKATLEPVALGELLDDIALRFKTRAQQAAISLQVKRPDILPMMALDASLIERLMVNLLDNAFRYTPSGGSITIELRSDTLNFSLSVTDTGRGLKEHELAHIFDRFYQGKSSRESNGQAGLGLAIVRRIVEIHAGQIVARNNADGGCCIDMRFPLG